MIANENSRTAELWRLPRVMGHVGLKKSSIYALIKKGDFPNSVKLTERARAWRAEEIIQWCKSRDPK
jgi:prophage regulatory protein